MVLYQLYPYNKYGYLDKRAFRMKPVKIFEIISNSLL